MREEEKRIKQEKWDEFKIKLKRFFSLKNLFHKKSLLEKTEEFNKKISQDNNKKRRYSFSNFENLKRTSIFINKN